MGPIPKEVEEYLDKALAARTMSSSSIMLVVTLALLFPEKNVSEIQDKVMDAGVHLQKAFRRYGTNMQKAFAKETRIEGGGE